MKYLTILLIVGVLIYLVFSLNGKKGSEDLPMKSSGNQAMDQTAKFVWHLVKKIQKRSPDYSATQIIEYMTSTRGSAELSPPSPELEPDAASMYKGPRPDADVFIQLDGKLNDFFKKHLLLSVDENDSSTIIARSYDDESDEALFTWKWSIKK